MAHSAGKQELMSRYWIPLGAKQRRNIPEVGQTIGLDRAAYVVTHASPATTTEEEDAHLKAYKPEARERRGPWNLTLRRVHGPVIYEENEFHETAIRVPARYWLGWHVYEEGRVPLCSCCQHPWPCNQHEIAKMSAEAAARMEAQMSKAQPGHCYGCGEVITSRQAVVRFPEGNVELPGFPPPTFHARGSCSGWVHQYREVRAKALPDATQVLTEDQIGRLL